MERKDEIGTLAREFDRLLERLEGDIAERERMRERVVFLDDRYDGSWVEAPVKVARWFVRRGFEPGTAVRFLFRARDMSMVDRYVDCLLYFGFFLGGLLLATFGFRNSLWLMAAGLALVLAGTMISLPKEIGVTKKKTKFSAILSKSREINLLSAARLFLFGSRDVWFVVGLPVFLASVTGWNFRRT